MRRIVGNNFARINNHHIVAVNCFFHIVGCEEYRKSCFFAKIVDDFPHLQPCFRVKSRCRFVKEQELRSVNKRPCNVNPSALATAQCAVFSFENFRKVKGLRKAFNSFGDFFFVESVI